MILLRIRKNHNPLSICFFGVFTTTKEARSFKAHRHIASILKLMEYCETTQPDKPDYSTLSDEELLEIMSQSVLG